MYGRKIARWEGLDRYGITRVTRGEVDVLLMGKQDPSGEQALRGSSVGGPEILNE